MLKFWIKCILLFSHLSKRPVLCEIFSNSDMDSSVEYDHELGNYEDTDDESDDLAAFENKLYDTRVEKHLPTPLKLKPRLKSNSIKHILLWNSPSSPSYKMQTGRSNFLKCSNTNCYITFNRDFNNLTWFDVIAFFAEKHLIPLPHVRLPYQKYVFVSIDPNDRYPITTNQLDGFFNWTWTYKLNSDLIWLPYIVTDSRNYVVGPKINARWIKHANMNPVPENLKKNLRGKTKAVAWITSHCKSSNCDDIFALKKILNERYQLNLDIYLFPRSKRPFDNEAIRRNYYFYIAFEDSCSNDYVTETLLYAVKNYAVPIVSGCAKYTRFLPDGSYINAKDFTLTTLAAKINRLVENFDKYVEYFRWTNHYVFRRTTGNPRTDMYCRICATLNNPSKMKKITVYENFKDWWNQRSTNLTIDMQKKKNRLAAKCQEEKGQYRSFGQEENTQSESKASVKRTAYYPNKNEEKTWYKKFLDFDWSYLYVFY